MNVYMCSFLKNKRVSLFKKKRGDGRAWILGREIGVAGGWRIRLFGNVSGKFSCRIVGVDHFSVMIGLRM